MLSTNILANHKDSEKEGDKLKIMFSQMKHLANESQMWCLWPKGTFNLNYYRRSCHMDGKLEEK